MITEIAHAKQIALLVGIALTSLLTGCIPNVRLTVETRDPQNQVIDRADVTNGDKSGREFRVNGGGTIVFIASADYSKGLQALDIDGGFTCNQISGGVGTNRQGTFNMNDPALPGQHPNSSSFQQQFAVQCAGGSFSGTAQACATTADGKSRSCTQNATFK